MGASMEVSTRVEQNEVIDLLAALVREMSENPPGAELGVASKLRGWLENRDVGTHIQPIGANRANLIARLPGTAAAPSLIFCGHMDTVPVGLGGWTHPPLSAEIDRGRMYGRGTSDMKGALASFAAALVSLGRRDQPLPGNVILVATAGEETDGIGVRDLLDSSSFEGAGALVVGEPTGLRLAIAHKGALWLRVTIAGVSAHGSTPHLGSNAIGNTCNFLLSLSSHAFLSGTHLLLGGPTVSPNLIMGGVAPNVVPDGCDVTLDVRTVPGMSAESVCSEIGRIIHPLLCVQARRREAQSMSSKSVCRSRPLKRRRL